MKRCSVCGTQVNDAANFCTACGSAALVAETAPVQQVAPMQPQGNPQGNVLYGQVQPAPANTAERCDNGIIPLGILGAVLFSLAGGLAYFVVYQLDIIAGICGWLIFFLAGLGYRLFARTKNKASIAALITVIVTTVVMIFVAEYFCVVFACYFELRSYGYSLLDTFGVMPEIFEEIGGEFAFELVVAYAFSALATIGDIIRIVKARKAQTISGQ